jgi:SPP1 gp7 family putative phage head morphogenesis protein
MATKENKWQRELRLKEAAQFKKTNAKLVKAYRAYLIEAKQMLHNLTTQYKDMSFSKRLELERTFEATKQLSEIVKEPIDDVAKALKEFKIQQGEFGYNGVFYEMEGKYNLQFANIGLDKKFLETVVNEPVAGKTLSQRLYKQRNELAKRTNDAIARGVINGDGYKVIAGWINNETVANYNQAVRIARTEAGRCRSITTQRAYKDAHDKGVDDIQKKWVATLDRKTRKQHQKLDGQTVKYNKTFDYNGSKAEGPRMFRGNPSLNINCRCTTVAIIDGISPDLRRNNESGKIDKFKTYDQWEKESKTRFGTQRWDIDGKKAKNLSQDTKQFKKYSKVMKVGKDVSAFQEMKYLTPEKWERLQDNYWVKSRLKDKTYGRKINEDKQKPHNYETIVGGKSGFNKGVDLQEIFDKQAGTGTVERDRNGKRTNKERIVVNRNVGFTFDKKGNKINTRVVKIHHSKKRTHIVPVKERYDDRLR